MKTGLLKTGLLLALVAAACSGSAETTSTTAQPNVGIGTTSSTTPGSTTTGSTGPGATTTITDPSTTTTTVDRETTTTLPRPQLADPVVVADQALLPLEGFTYGSEPEADLLEALEFQLDITIGPGAILGWGWDVVSTPQGERVLVASIYPDGPLRGDPALPADFAFAMGGFTSDEERIERGRRTFQKLRMDGADWYVWANNTHVFITVGEGTPPIDALEALADANQGEYQWQAGDCLWLVNPQGVPFSPFGREVVVPCVGLHTHEVIVGDPLPEGPDAAFDGIDISQRRTARCHEAFESYIGIEVRDSVLDLIQYMPNLDEWNEGDRYVGCVVSRRGRDGAAIRVAGPLEDAGETVKVSREPGTCHLSEPNAPVVPCTEGHLLEFIGSAMHPAAPGAPFPGPDVIREETAGPCDVLLSAYATNRESGGSLVETAVVFEPSPGAWARGDRSSYCFALAATPEFEPQLVIGSFAGEWRPLGPPDGGISA